MNHFTEGKSSLPQRLHGTLHHAQAHLEAQIALQFLRHDIGIAAVPDQLLRQPRSGLGLGLDPNPRTGWDLIFKC
jgi:hypothetical protein